MNRQYAGENPVVAFWPYPLTVKRKVFQAFNRGSIPRRVIMNTKDKGIITEIKVIEWFVCMGYTVSLPYGDNARYDLIVDTGTTLRKIQCKTARFRNDCIVFNTVSTTRDKVSKSYNGYVDYFCIYSPHTNKLYAMKVDDVSKESQSLRIKRLKYERKDIKYAKDYLIQNTFSAYRSMEGHLSDKQKN